MKTLKFALSALLAAGFSAALPSVSHAQYPGGAYGGAQSATAEARRQIKEAETEVTRIRSEMNRMKTRIAARYEGKEEWETAKNNLKTAETTYEASRKKAMAKLFATPEYKAAKAKQLKADETMAANAAGAAKADARALDKAQQDRLDSGLALHKLETDALAADPSIAENKAKVAEAKKAWEALQDELKEVLQQDPEYIASQQQLEQAQAQVDQMKQSLAQTAASERQARNQQRQSERQSRSGRSGGAGGYGGGYGGGRSR